MTILVLPLLRDVVRLEVAWHAILIAFRVFRNRLHICCQSCIIRQALAVLFDWYILRWGCSLYRCLGDCLRGRALDFANVNGLRGSGCLRPSNRPSQRVRSLGGCLFRTTSRPVVVGRSH